MDRLDELALLVAILDGGSLASGARATRRSAPAVTRALRGFERRIGVQLVERSTRRIAPTQAGRELAERARLLLEQYREALEETASGAAAPRGSLRICAPLEFGHKHVAAVVESFLQANPQVRVELIFSDQIVDLVEQNIDVAIRIGELGDSSLVAKPVGKVRRVVVASADYLQRRGTPRHPKDLSQHECLAQVRGGQIIEWPFVLPRSKRMTMRPDGRFIVNSAQAIVAAACHGHGLAMPLSYQVAPELAAGKLVRVLAKFAVAPVPVNLVFTKARRTTARARAFVDHATETLRAVDQAHWL